MADIELERSHTLGRARAREVAEEIAAKLKEKIQVTYRWEDDVLHFERTGASGFIEVDDDEVRVEVTLGVLLKPMKGMIEGKIVEYLDTRLK